MTKLMQNLVALIGIGVFFLCIDRFGLTNVIGACLLYGFFAFLVYGSLIPRTPTGGLNPDGTPRRRKP